MDVVPLTLTISLTLVFTFVIFFLREQTRGRASSAERDSLLPLAEEGAQLVPVGVRYGSSAQRCDCLDGSRAPCPGCLRSVG